MSHEVNDPWVTNKDVPFWGTGPEGSPFYAELWISYWTPLPNPMGGINWIKWYWTGVYQENDSGIVGRNQTYSGMYKRTEVPCVKWVRHEHMSILLTPVDPIRRYFQMN